MSFYSKSLYKDVAKNWTGLCLLYLLSLVALCLIPEVMTIQSDLSGYLNTEAPKIIRQFPTITVTKGTASVDQQQPFYIRDEKTGQPIIIIDTTGRVTTLNGSPASILVGKEAVIVRRDNGDTRSFDLSGIDRVTVDKTALYNLTDTIDEWFAFMIYPFALFISFLLHAAEVFFYAAVGVLFLRLSRASMPFRILVRLAAVSITPVMIVSTVLFVAGQNVPYWWLFSFAASMGYLFYAIRAASSQDVREVSA
jgi:hypothetical protein